MSFCYDCECGFYNCSICGPHIRDNEIKNRKGKFIDNRPVTSISNLYVEEYEEFEDFWVDPLND